MNETYVSGVDAELIDQLPPAVLAGFAVLEVYGPRFGSTQGPARETPIEWLMAQAKPCWMIFFPGADPELVVPYVRKCAPRVVGVIIDLEPAFETDAASIASCCSLGEALFRAQIPSCIYSHQKTCQALGAHFDAQIWDGFAEVPSDLPAHVGVQWGQKVADNGTPYDLDAYDPWFANPGGLIPEIPAMAGPFNDGQGVWYVAQDGTAVPIADDASPNGPWTTVSPADLSSIKSAEASAFQKLLAAAAGSSQGLPATLEGTLTLQTPPAPAGAAAVEAQPAP